MDATNAIPRSKDNGSMLFWHSPMCISFEDNEDKDPKSFKLLNHLAEHKDFMSEVNEEWQGRNENNIMKDVGYRSKKVKQAMKYPNKAEDSTVGDKIKLCT